MLERPVGTTIKGDRSGAFGEFGVTEAELYCKLIAQRYD